MNLVALIEAGQVVICRTSASGVVQRERYAGEASVAAICQHLAAARAFEPEAHFQALAYYATNCCEDLFLDVETGGFAG